ncbi:hypothetical protein B6U74_06325 [Candidatus Bathyarchaeota archaeon ex4484_205]|nr:MAG: hypothetical protein B6U74_06325 [Candidatus Bathyarchaeota archaeon ex4484_205]
MAIHNLVMRPQKIVQVLQGDKKSIMISGGNVKKGDIVLIHSAPGNPPIFRIFVEDVVEYPVDDIPENVARELGYASKKELVRILKENLITTPLYIKGEIETIEPEPDTDSPKILEIFSLCPIHPSELEAEEGDDYITIRSKWLDIEMRIKPNDNYDSLKSAVTFAFTLGVIFGAHYPEVVSFLEVF